jgi:hypothetical protein
MYALTHIVDFSNLLDSSVSQPLADEIDGQDQMLELRTESASSPARHLEKAVFGAP